MKKILLYLLAILSPFIFISKVYAVSLGSNKFAPDYIWENTNKKQPRYEIVSNLKWWGESGNAEKWSFEYDNLDLDINKRYTISGALYFQNSTKAFSTPIVSISNIYCSIENTYNYNYQIMKDYELDNQNISEIYEWSNYGTNISQLVSFTCESVPIEVPISYLNVLFPSNISSVRITELSILESSVSSITQQQQETNDKLQDSINKQQEIKQEQEKTNQELGKLNDNLTNSDSPDNMGGLSNSAGWLPAGPIDSILNLPLSMLNNISDNLNKSCQPVNLPLPFVNKNLPLPCLTSIYSQIDGIGPWITTISVIASAFILFSYLIKLYKWVDDTLTFRENNYIDNWGGV